MKKKTTIRIKNNFAKTPVSLFILGKFSLSETKKRSYKQEQHRESLNMIADGIS